jgi:isoquinoline 1-oxidoreductase beta subunit
MNRPLIPDPSRRRFLIAAGAAGAAFGFAATAEAAVSLGPYSGAPAFEPSLWYAIDAQGIVTVNVVRAEMGQHVGTALARIVADELEADWDKVRIIHVDTDPKWGLMVTGGSWSVWQSYPFLSQAGAAGRIALIEAGAKMLGAPASACIARKGKVFAGKRAVSYGDIVAKASPTRNWPPCRSSRPPSAG